MNTSLVSDLSDGASLCPSQNILLKPFAKVNICVALPQLKVAGQTISNWEVMEKLKSMCMPNQFTLLRVGKSTLDFVRFEGEVENKSLVSTFISMLDSKHIKLSGCAGLLKITCGESKIPFPSRHDWDSFFRDSKDFDETQPGERPDTVHLSNIPCKFFTPKGESTVNASSLFQCFATFGEIRNIDIPLLDPYRSEIQPSAPSNFKTFSYGSRLNFEAFVQYKEYIGFAKCMDTLRGKKLVLKESDGKAIAATIKVDFDRTKHLSARSISHRLQEKKKIEKLQEERERQKRKERELEEKRVLAEKMRQIEKVRDQDERRRRREEKRRKRQEEKRAQEEAEKLTKRIALEERKLLLAQRKLEAIRLLSALLDRVKSVAQQEEVKKLEEEIAEKAKEEKLRKLEEERIQKRKDLKRKIKLEKQEAELKDRLEKRKKNHDFKREQKKRKNTIKNLHSGTPILSAVIKPSSENEI